MTTSVRLRLVLAGLLLALTVASVVAYGAVFRVELRPGFPSVHARIVLLPCNGTLVPFYQVVAAAPPGYRVDVAFEKLVYAPGQLPWRIRAYVSIPLRNVSISLEATCPAVIVQSGRWRGVWLSDVLVAAYTSDGRVLRDALLSFRFARVGPSRPVDAWTYRVVESVATLLYPSGWEVSTKPYQVGIIVVTRQVLLSAVEEWAKIKEREGYRVTIITVDELCREHADMVARLGLREVIRWAVEQVYKSAPQVYRYLVIVGDDSGRYWGTKILSCDILEPWEVPTAYFYNPASSLDLQTSHSGYFIPSDIYYATFDGSWDANGNGVLGEYPQDVPAYDPYPELIPARIPARSLAEARAALLGAALNYPITDSIILAGSVLYYYGEGGEKLVAQGDTMLEALYDNLLAGYEWIYPIRLYEHYPVNTTITSPQQLNGNLTRTNMVAVLSEERGIVAINAHGSATCVWRKVWIGDENGNGVPDPNEIVYKPFLCASDAYAILPQMLYTVDSCLTAYYDNPQSTSLGEAAALHGAVYIGWDRITFGPRLPPDEEMNPEAWCCDIRLTYYFYAALIGQQVDTVGDALLKAIIEYVNAEPLTTSGYMGNVSRRVFFALTLLGDPTRLAYSYPSMFSSEELTLPALPDVPTTVRLRLIRYGVNQPIANATVYVYVYRGGYSVEGPVAIVRTSPDGFLAVNLTVGVGGGSFLFYYPGSAYPPKPTEPAIAVVKLNTSLRPWVIAEPSVVKTQQWLRVYGCGFPPYSPLDVLADGLLVTRVYTNATGCFDYRVVLPTSLPLGEVVLRVVDVQYPGLRAETKVLLVYNTLLDILRVAREARGLAATAKDYARLIALKLEELYETVKELNQSITRLLATSQKTSVNTTRALRELAASIALLEEQLARLNATLASSTSSIRAEARAQAELVLSTLSKLRKEAERLAERLDAISADLGEATGSLTALRLETRKLLASLDSLRATAAALLGYAKENAERLAAVGSKLDALSEKIGGAENATKALEKMLARIAGVVNTTAYGVLGAERMLRGINATLGSLRESQVVLASKLESLKAKLGEISSELVSLRALSQRLESKLGGDTVYAAAAAASALTALVALLLAAKRG